MKKITKICLLIRDEILANFSHFSEEKKCQNVKAV
jgi:hypothetical protein